MNPALVRAIMNHAASFHGFAPRSVSTLAGYEEAEAEAACDRLYLQGRLRRYRLGGETWYCGRDQLYVKMYGPKNGAVPLMHLNWTEATQRRINYELTRKNPRVKNAV
jgi:hypothetical protein